jgi:hypothetical protein
LRCAEACVVATDIRIPCGLRRRRRQHDAADVSGRRTAAGFDALSGAVVTSDVNARRYADADYDADANRYAHTDRHADACRRRNHDAARYERTVRIDANLRLGRKSGRRTDVVGGD